jgi:tetratricopeptide (TPR) repeat protein
MQPLRAPLSRPRWPASRRPAASQQSGADAARHRPSKPSRRGHEISLRAHASGWYMHRNLGTLLSEAGDDDPAERELVRAVELAPSDAKNHPSLGRSLAKRKRVTKALAEYAAAVRLAPRTVAIRQWGCSLATISVPPKPSCEGLSPPTRNPVKCIVSSERPSQTEQAPRSCVGIAKSFRSAARRLPAARCAGTNATERPAGPPRRHTMFRSRESFARTTLLLRSVIATGASCSTSMVGPPKSCSAKQSA